MMSQERCPDDVLLRITREASGDADVAIRSIAGLLSSYGGDARLWFLKGSLLAAEGAYREGQDAFEQALLVEPNLSIARFQLGLLKLTSADAAGARATWAPLASLPASDPIRLFAEGLDDLIDDRFPECVKKLERGIELNTTNAPLNANMQMMIERVNSRDANRTQKEELNAVQWLLQQYGGSQTSH